MEIRDVIHSLRETTLQHTLAIASMRSEMDMLERFTWNLVDLLISAGYVEITFDPDYREEDDDATPPADPTLF